MTRSRITRGLMLPAALSVTVLLSATACFDDAVTDATGEQPAVNVLLGPGETVLPAGELGLEDIRIANFDLSLPDAFDRAEAPLENYTEQETEFGAAMGMPILRGIPGSNTDPRLPVPTRDAAAPGEFWGLYNPAWTAVGEGAWDLFGEVGGLAPDQTYTVVLARMALDVRGALDNAQVLTGQPVTEPDSLFFLGGTETGYAGVTCNFSALSPVTASTNPVALGVINTDGAGAATVDCIPFASGDSPWWRNAASENPPGAADSIPFGVNSPDGQLDPGMYNYLLLYEGDIDPANPVPDGSPAVRIQVGPDIDADGNVIENAFAPFPAGIVDTETFRELPGGVDAFAVPGQINLSLSGLPVLGGSATYAVYLFNEETDSYALATTFESPGPDAETPVEITLTPEETGLDFGQFNQVIVSIETGAPGETPSEARFLAREFLSTDFALSQGPFTFGRADLTPAQQFQIAGSGEATFIRDSLLVDLRRLSRPPAGFHYQSYLIRGELGSIEAEQRLHTIELDELGNAVDRVGEDEVGSFANFDTYVVALEPDAAPGLTPAFIQVSENYLDKFGEDYFLNGTGDDNGDGGT